MKLLVFNMVINDFLKFPATLKQLKTRLFVYRRNIFTKSFFIKLSEKIVLTTGFPHHKIVLEPFNNKLFRIRTEEK